MQAVYVHGRLRGDTGVPLWKGSSSLHDKDDIEPLFYMRGHPDAPGLLLFPRMLQRALIPNASTMKLL